ncbi:MAG: STAS/SEC14 domain-containing protein [Betaproteobacteria bacterium]
MLDYSILLPEGILVLEPQAPLTKGDFGALSTAADLYLSNHDKLRGVLIHAKTFPGWEDFGGFTAHLRFVREHHEKVERVAVATDSPLAGLLESLGKHFISAEVKHFPYMDKAKALDWLKATPGLGVLA